MAIAIEHSVKSRCHKRHAAVVCKSGRVLAIGINKSRVNNRWHPNMEGRPATIHAEIAALNQIKDARGAVLYVARTTQNGSRTMISRPCDECAKEIIARGIKAVIYTT